MYIVCSNTQFIICIIWAILGSPELSWALLGSHGLHWAPLGSPELSWAPNSSSTLPLEGEGMALLPFRKEGEATSLTRGEGWPPLSLTRQGGNFSRDSQSNELKVERKHVADRKPPLVLLQSIHWNTSTTSSRQIASMHS